MSETLKRPRCTHCARPLRNCICTFITRIHNQVEILILQHPMEVNNAKNTAGLLHLSLDNSHMIIGEHIAEKPLHDYLYAGNKTPVLLYPDTPEQLSMGLLTPGILSGMDTLPSETVRLVVLDGTWRKSRKMLYLHPLLQVLPRLALKNTPASIYTIRKAHSENQLSTLEASCYALQQLEHEQANYQPLLAAFGQFIEQQSTFIPD